MAPPKRNKTAAPIVPPPTPPDYDRLTPKFCLAHLRELDHLSPELKADFADALYRRSRITWLEIKQSNRHKLGTELIPVGQIKPSMPPRFGDLKQVTVFRYSGLRSMIGHRVNDVFHVLWIERNFGDVYDH